MRRLPVVVAVLAVVVLATIGRVAATHRVFSPTWDEPAHVFAGYQYLVHRDYTFDKSHPPLARAVFAFPLRHAAVQEADLHERIGEIFESKGDYMAGVVAARRGNLLFLAIALVAIAFWAADLFGAAAAILSVSLFALLPPVLAHAGLATTDLPATALVAAAAAVLWRWYRAPSWRWTLLLALTIGAGLLTKFSFPMYAAIFVLCLVASRLLHARAEAEPEASRIGRGAAAFAVALVIVWAGYWFHDLPRFFTGFGAVLRMNAAGRPAYFAGEVRSDGWWEYFPVLLGIKTPIPFLISAGVGAAAILRERRHRSLLAASLLILLMVVSSRINLGVRHVLLIYIPLAVVAARGVETLWTSRTRWIAPLLMLWLVADSVAAHPDYLPWSNALAGAHPERIAVDSNFDWGQDVLRLRDACRAAGVRELHVALHGTTDLRRIGLPPARDSDPFRFSPGWHAVSESIILPAQVRDPGAYRWLTSGRDFRRIGRSIRLYYVDGADRQR